MAALAPFAACVALPLVDAEHGGVAAGLRDPRMRCVPFGSLR